MRERGGIGAIGLSDGALDAAQERQLRARLERWAYAHFPRDAASDFDDVWQEAWCRLLTGERRGRITRDPENALRWALRNTFLNRRRHRDRHPTVALDAAPEQSLHAPATAEPHRWAEQREAAAFLYASGGDLPKRQWQILLLGGIGLKGVEIQRKLHIGKGTYYRDKATALQTLAAQAGEAFGHDELAA